MTDDLYGYEIRVYKKSMMYDFRLDDTNCFYMAGSTVFLGCTGTEQSRSLLYTESEGKKWNGM